MYYFLFAKKGDFVHWCSAVRDCTSSNENSNVGLVVLTNAFHQFWIISFGCGVLHTVLAS